MNTKLEDNKPIIKRVVAMSGDEVRFDYEEGIFYRNGQPVDEPYIKEKITRKEDFMPNSNVKRIVPEGCYWVKGDNSNNSTDSRDSQIGFVRRDQIIGRTRLRVFPLSKIKFFG
jgi:signal peptidase I